MTPGDHLQDSLQPCAGENAPAISLSKINKNFPGPNGERLEVLKDIDLAVADHAIVGLLGASGAGKSTLLNIIAGIVKPDSGRVCICGAPSDELNVAKAQGQHFGYPYAVIHRADALRFIDQLEAHAYDVAFADPPYDLGLATAVAERWLALPFANVIGIEHRDNEVLPGSGERGRYGGTAITFYGMEQR